MIHEFSLEVSATSRERALDELDIYTVEFLRVVQSTEESPWECIDEFLTPNNHWIPGKGPYGEIRAYKGFRKFQLSPREVNFMNETPTPETPVEEKTPTPEVEEIVDDPNEGKPVEDAPQETPEAPEE